MKLTLKLGDCTVRMDGLADGSIDALISDPPYDLTTSKGGKGFMGKAWDGTGIAFSQEFWGRVYRVMAPGGVAKAFGGTRTFHRMAAAMEEAGFQEIHLEAWGYGCLPSDAEILTESGWRPGADVGVGDNVACWDPATGSIRLEAVQETFFGPFSGDLVSFLNDNTDQLLTPNHRVWKKHRIREMVGAVRQESEEPEWVPQEAGSISRWNNIRLPLAGVHEGMGIGGTNLAELLGWVWAEGGFDHNGTGVRITQSSVNQPFVDAIQVLLDEMVPGHSHYTRVREHTSRNAARGTYTYTEHTWYFSGEPAQRVRDLLPDKHPTWGLIWRMTQEEKKAFMWAAIRGDGQIKQGKVLVDGTRSVENYTFFQKHGGDRDIFQALCHLTNRQGRLNPKKSSVCVHDNPTTQLQSRHLKSSVPVAYDGDVWCVRVSTGAFVARRNGLVFITGNSGFPKSMNVSKALDKMKGAVREPKRVPHTGEAMMRHGGENTRPWIEEALKNGYHETPGDTPASPEAEAWDGWGTALKPAWEPILVGRKPV